MLRITYRQTPTGWRMRYIGGNNEIIASAEGYTSKANCLNGIKLLQEASLARVIKGNPILPQTWTTTPVPGHRRIFYWLSSPNNWRWQYRAANGEIVWTGEGFTSEVACRHSVSLIQQAVHAPVREDPPPNVVTFRDATGKLITLRSPN